MRPVVIFLAGVVLLQGSHAFCPDGCACDEDLLHVTCLRSQLEVGVELI